MTDAELDIAAKRAVAEADIARLQQEMGSATLDGREFDAERLAAARAELEALDAAESEVTRRVRAAQGDVVAAMHRQARTELETALEGYLGAVERAESTAQALVDDLKLIEAHAGTMRAQFHILNRTLPVTLDGGETRAKLSAMVITKLASMLAGGRNFGALRLPSVMPVPDLTEWAEKYVAAFVRPCLTEGD